MQWLRYTIIDIEMGATDIIIGHKHENMSRHGHMGRVGRPLEIINDIQSNALELSLYHYKFSGTCFHLALCLIFQRDREIWLQFP